MERWVIEKQVDRVILAIPSASVDFREDIARRSRQIGVPFAAMKSLEESLIARIR